jgi:hypothetical protein|tara:strand:+ start:1055 stop:1876 length:822 start_codon:yes stop_codon:yes gene_type:complete
MNKLQMTEMLRGHHPEITARQAEMYIKYAADRIAEETNLCKVTEVLSSVAGKRYYDVPRDTIRITRVWFNDVLIPKLIGEPIIDDDEFYDDTDGSDTELSTPTANASNKRFWFFRNTDMTDTSTGGETSETDNAGGTFKKGYSRTIAIVELVNNAITRDGRTSNYQSCSITGDSNIRIERIRYPRDFSVEPAGTQTTTRDSTSELTLSPLQDIPEEFHHTLLDGAISIGYKYPPNIDFNLCSAFLQMFEKGISKIKRFERTKTGTGFIKPHDF